MSDELFDTLAQCEDVDLTLKRQAEEPTLEDRVASLEEENGKLRQALKVMIRALAPLTTMYQRNGFEESAIRQMMEETGLAEQEF
jgi:hypothetical protein